MGGLRKVMPLPPTKTNRSQTQPYRVYMAYKSETELLSSDVTTLLSTASKTKAASIPLFHNHKQHNKQQHFACFKWLLQTIYGILKKLQIFSMTSKQNAK